MRKEQFESVDEMLEYVITEERLSDNEVQIHEYKQKVLTNEARLKEADGMQRAENGLMQIVLKSFAGSRIRR